MALPTNERKAFYTIKEQFGSSYFDEKGCCFLMNFQPDPNAFNAGQLGQLMWVTSGKFFDTQNHDTQEKKFFVERIIKNKSSTSYQFDMAQVQTSASGISFIKCRSPDKSLQRNFLTFGCWETRPNEVFAYLYDGKNELRQLRFVKSHGTKTYTLDKRSSGNAFSIRDAVGAPVIHDKGGDQVVGLLDRNKNGNLYPVFFDLETFKTGQVGASLPSTDFSQDIEEKPPTTAYGDQTDVGLPSDRDEKDSPLTHGLTGIPSGRDEKDSPTLSHCLAGIPSGRDEKDSPTLSHCLAGLTSSRDEKDSPALLHGITDNMRQVNLAGNNGPLSGIQEENNQAGCAGLFQDQQQAQRHTAAPASRCIKNETLSSVRQVKIYDLFSKLKILLDPEDSLGLKDYRGLANSFGYDYNMMTYLGSKNVGSPTVAILHDQCSTCTIWELHEKLKDIERNDAAEKVEEYIQNYKCKCDGCNIDLR